MAEQSRGSKEALSLNFGKRLAHTDKVVRDRGFKTLQTWLKKNPDLTRLDYMKLWKGLYFGMWMSDKRPVQQDLGVSIALLLNDVPSDKQTMWIDTFWETMQTAWEKLDVHRLNKYLLFARIVIAEAFKALRVTGWQPERARSHGETFVRGTGCGGKGKATSLPSLGFLLQFVRIFWEELLPQLGQAPDAPQASLMELLEPFCMLVEESPVRNLVKRVHEHVLRQAPRVIQQPLAARLLVGAARTEIFQSNREALYDTVDYLEREARRPLPDKSAAPPAAAAVVATPAAGRKRKAKAAAGGTDQTPSPVELPPAAAGATEEGGKAGARRTRRGKKRKAAKGNGEGGEKQEALCAGPSPLLLPKAALPLVKVGAKRKKKRTASA